MGVGIRAWGCLAAGDLSDRRDHAQRKENIVPQPFEIDESKLLRDGITPLTNGPQRRHVLHPKGLVMNDFLVQQCTT